MANVEVDVKQRIYALQHIDVGDYICLVQDGIDYLACFTDPDTALEFRAVLNLQEYVDLYVTSISESSFSHYWLDGESVVVSRG